MMAEIESEVLDSRVLLAFALAYARSNPSVLRKFKHFVLLLRAP